MDAAYLLFATSRGPTPPIPDVRHVQGGFCNLHDSVVVAPSTQGRPIFSPYFTCLPPSEQAEWIAIWQDAGFTHQAIMIDDPVYPEGLPQYGGAWYPAPSFAPSAGQFLDAAGRLLEAGIVPIIFTTTGEYPLDLDRYAQRLRQYCLPLVGRAQFVEGWEPYWTDLQQATIFDTMRRELGPDACLALHMPQNYIHNGEGGPRDWQTIWKEVNVFLMQLSPYGNAENFESVRGGWEQCITRVIQTPGVPYYLEGRDVTVCLFEHQAYFTIRDWATETDVQVGVEYARSLGVRYFGNANHGDAT